VGNTAEKVAGKGLLLRDTESEIAACRAAVRQARLIRQDSVLVPQSGKDIAWKCGI